MGADIRPTSTVRMGETTWTLEVFFSVVLFLFLFCRPLLFSVRWLKCVCARGEVVYIFIPDLSFAFHICVPMLCMLCAYPFSSFLPYIQC